MTDDAPALEPSTPPAAPGGPVPDGGGSDGSAEVHHEGPALFGTFAGVYRPVFLTILGAMLYLREGWLVGNAGLGGALLVIGAAYIVTGTTALSISSIATNVRLKAGGAFAIISSALGLEAGGAIGVPLYLAQTISSVMYLYAFSEGAAYILPEWHDPRIVVGIAFVGVGVLVFVSAALAARAQQLMFGVILVAIASAFGGWAISTPQVPSLIGRFPEASLFECFALFFPAATGIMVGAGMSGSLASPRRSIPFGTMSAWGSTLAIYVLAAIWYGTVATREELLTNNLAMMDHSLFGGSLVLVGLLVSTLMAALSSLVAAPRLLQAMAEHQVVPGSDWLQKVTPSGEPRNAVLATLGIAALGLTAGSLDAIAPIITSFFVMTYFAVNLVVFLEQALGLVSWRPTFRVPTAVPLVGLVSCAAALTLSSPAGGLPEVLFVVGIYLYLARRKRVDTPWETVQSGVAQTLASWAALKAAQMRRSPRTWKPDLLVPVSTLEEARAMCAVAEAIVAYRGSMKIVALKDDPELEAGLEDLVREMREREVFSSWHLMPEEYPGQGARLSINAMQGTFFAPNLVLLSPRAPQDVIQQVADHATLNKVGVVLAFDDPNSPFQPPQRTAVWVSDRSPEWALGLRVANLDLPVLLAYLLTRPREGTIHLASVIRDAAFTPQATDFLNDLIELGRIPSAEPHVLTGAFLTNVTEAPPVDVHLFGLPEVIDVERLRAIREAAGSTCLFVRDSGQESALS